jgi:hypothetical protein
MAMPEVCAHHLPRLSDAQPGVANGSAFSVFQVGSNSAQEYSKPIESTFQERLPSSRCIKNDPALCRPSSPNLISPDRFRYSTKTYQD